MMKLVFLAFIVIVWIQLAQIKGNNNKTRNILDAKELKDP